MNIVKYLKPEERMTIAGLFPNLQELWENKGVFVGEVS